MCQEISVWAHATAEVQLEHLPKFWLLVRATVMTSNYGVTFNIPNNLGVDNLESLEQIPISHLLDLLHLGSSWFWDMSANMRTKIIRTQRVTPAPHFAVEVSGHRVAPRTNSRHLRPVVAESIGPPGGDSAVLRYRHPPGQNLQNGTFTYRTKLGIVDKMLNIYWTCNCIYIYMYICICICKCICICICIL